MKSTEYPENPVLRVLLAFLVLVALSPLASGAGTGKHLFILSGQSNMAQQKPANNPETSFTPVIVKEFGEDNVDIVRYAVGGTPIRYWYKGYKFPEGDKRKSDNRSGSLYKKLIEKVKAVADGKTYDTVTFVWMQGETDAQEGLAGVYEASFKGILKDIKEDLGIDKLNFVIGRISDFAGPYSSVRNLNRWKDWEAIRQVQVKLAEDSDVGLWVDTDDLNDRMIRKQSINLLHYHAEGYKRLGERFANAAIALVKGEAKNWKNKKKSPADARHVKHLFLLIGGENMLFFDPTRTFIPALEKKFGEQNILVVKCSERPIYIRWWDKEHVSPDKSLDESNGLAIGLLQAILEHDAPGVTFDTVTLISLMGVGDALAGSTDGYAASFNRMFEHLKAELGKPDLTAVIGRISDYGDTLDDAAARKNWEAVRQAQVAIAEGNKHIDWVDTDDLNDVPPKQKQSLGTKYTFKGARTLGTRFAEKASSLIESL